ncbi:dTDP-4-dehydrorhamnose reductase [Acetobacter aceti NRIC 0242]|uniref:dTDP-4-dehydrorhamnose reductase n=1 Tax=Acetobacter aceti NBRC 14818 TaxID=887700 RepID=A0AB33ID62_ACEAC|nr:dTDP-4-dehydrorhamnose reductase [Acetobacter aceti]TCS33809.1 dTDP-4-dehydrorhamnose reductase [Acetobacter aceti NBRC 14818]BCK76185.1 NAD(P)-dependent oxidoreductase [Acetobacter aceti NBRC 14818]GAN57748.1 dTDP-4-dehydrorhamnose reductase [Acetobacter aceti NBRC 14818]GBO80068.1 dTDP-4-dehydrorhamnose reductase [Acetobacter aceti NRIC 0242]
MTDTSSKGPILVTGGNGQLATSLANLGGPRIDRVGRPEFDFAKPETIEAVLDAHKPVAVVNAAAWTAVDLAETEVAGAEAANCTGPALLAAACAKRNIPFIHVSTDYVFSGDKGSPYLESDPVSPETVYGRTKAEGEQKVLAADPKAIILRTSWVYSAHGKNFVRTMINAGAKNPALKVVGDQRGNPTSSDDLAEAILSIIALIERDGWKDQYAGIYHACGTGEATWHELAVAALENAVRHGQKMPEVAAIRTEDWPTPAKRPADSRMDNSKLNTVFGVKMPDWRQSVTRTVDTLFSQTPA